MYDVKDHIGTNGHQDMRSYKPSTMRFHNFKMHILAFFLQINQATTLKCLENNILMKARSSLSYQKTALCMSTSNSNERKRIAVIGGGASGMFAATAAAEYINRYNAGRCEVIVFEGTSRTMSKVRISGGGRVSVLWLKLLCLYLMFSNCIGLIIEQCSATVRNKIGSNVNFHWN